jgi:lipoprotein-anchoring transpeptidase ErfK/SrfK
MTDQLTKARFIRRRATGVRVPAEAMRWASVAGITFAVTAALAAPTVAAPRNNAPAQQARPARATEAFAPREAGEPIMAVVSIKSQQVIFYDADGWILRAPVSTGTTGRETPAGVFAVVEKDKDHHSSLYDDASMPNMQRITWSGIALHGGPLPGYAASHGCVRMPFDVAEKLFDKTRIGMRVIISPQDAEPVDFSHPALFVPKQEAIDAAPARAEKLSAEADEAAKAAAAAKAAIATAKRDAAAAPLALRKLEYSKNRAEAELAYAERALASPAMNAKSDEAKAAAESVQQKAAAKADELRGEVDAAKTELKTKQSAIAEALALAKTTEAKRIETAKIAKDAKLALEPVSVFISRATRKIYVRRDTHKAEPDGGERFETLEFPINIENPGKPIGTHIFTAIARTDAGLRWNAVTIDGGDTAKDALDRIEFPQEVLDLVAPTALPRSSIIISDEPANRETNYRTEFVVVLNNQPQGGLAMRARPEDHPDGFENAGGFFSSWFNNGGFQDNSARPRGAWGSQDSAARQPRGFGSSYPGQQNSW